tara:strand:- start:173 stop:337 length:165 start_codon:yes stop_codon:yes gene_type:complete
LASIQFFRILCEKVIEELQNQLSDKDNKHISYIEIADAIEEFEYVNSYLYFIEA